ncbi:MAG: tetratricopeptide repeat protein [bacterium]
MPQMVLLIIGFFLGWIVFHKNWQIQRQKSKTKKEANEYYIKSLNLIIEQNFNAALVALKQVVILDTDHVEAYLKLGDIYRKKGNFEKAIKIHEGITLRQTISRDMLVKTYFCLLNDFIMISSKDWDKIKGIVNKLMGFGIKELSLNISFKNILKRLEMWEEAYEIQKRILKLQNSQDKNELALLMSFIGDNHMKRQDIKEALKCYKEAVDLHEGCINAHIGLGNIYYNESKIQKAIEEWQTVINLDPQSLPKIDKKLEDAYFEEQEFEKMISFYEEMLAKYPNVPEINFALGEIYEKMGQKDKAINLYLEVVRNKSNFGRAYRNLYLLYLKSGKKDEALAIFNKIDEVFIKKNKD